jgi:hypothetical protein
MIYLDVEDTIHKIVLNIQPPQVRLEKRSSENHETMKMMNSSSATPKITKITHIMDDPDF